MGDIMKHKNKQLYYTALYGSVYAFVIVGILFYSFMVAQTDRDAYIVQMFSDLLTVSSLSLIAMYLNYAAWYFLWKWKIFLNFLILGLLLWANFVSLSWGVIFVIIWIVWLMYAFILELRTSKVIES